MSTTYTYDCNLVFLFLLYSVKTDVSLRLTFGRRLDGGQVRHKGGGAVLTDGRVYMAVTSHIAVCDFHGDRVIRAEENLNGPLGAAEVDLEALSTGRADGF